MKLGIALKPEKPAATQTAQQPSPGTAARDVASPATAQLARPARVRAHNLQTRARALRKSSDAASYCFNRLELRTKHLGKSFLLNGVTPSVPARSGAAPASTTRPLRPSEDRNGASSEPTSSAGRKLNLRRRSSGIRCPPIPCPR
jgi:hypothetical protein